MKKLSLTTLARALADIASERMSEEKEKRAVHEFIKLISKSGMMSKSDNIINLAREYLLKKKGNRVVVVQTPRTINHLQKKLTGAFLKSGDKISYEINPDLIAGIKITINDEKQLDFSLKRKLEETFER